MALIKQITLNAVTSGEYISLLEYAKQDKTKNEIKAIFGLFKDKASYTAIKNAGLNLRAHALNLHPIQVPFISTDAVQGETVEAYVYKQTKSITEMVNEGTEEKPIMVDKFVFAGTVDDL